MIKKIILIFLFLQNMIFTNPIELDFMQFDNYKNNVNNITRQVKDHARRTNPERREDFSRLPEGYLIAMSTPALESLEIQRDILKHLLEEHSNEIENNKELQFEFVERAVNWEENYELWTNIKNRNY